MINFEIAIGIDGATLNDGMARLYDRSDIRSGLFKGSRSGDVAGLPYSVDYDVQEAPTFDLATTAQDAFWARSIDGTGNRPSASPPPGTFAITLPRLLATISLADQPPLGGTSNDVRLFCAFLVRNGAPSIAPLSIYVDESGMTGVEGDNDRGLLNGVLLPLVVAQLTAVLASFEVPALPTIAGVSLQTPTVAVASSHLVLASSRADKPLDPAGFVWPDDRVFVLLAPTLVQEIAVQEFSQKLVNQILPPPGGASGSFTGGSWNAQAKVLSFDSLTLDPNDPTSASVRLAFGFQAEVKPLGGPCALSAATSKF